MAHYVRLDHPTTLGGDGTIKPHDRDVNEDCELPRLSHGCDTRLMGPIHLAGPRVNREVREGPSKFPVRDANDGILNMAEIQTTVRR